MCGLRAEIYPDKEAPPPLTHACLALSTSSMLPLCTSALLVRVCFTCVPSQEVCKARRGAADTLRALRGVLGDQLLYLSESVELLAVGNVIAASTGDLESVVASAIAVLTPTGGSE
jgi:hypothetical protein